MTGTTRHRFIPMFKTCNSIAIPKHIWRLVYKIFMDKNIIHFLLEIENFFLSKPPWGYILSPIAGHRLTHKIKSNNSFQRQKRIILLLMGQHSFIDTYETHRASWDICGLVLEFHKTPSWHNAMTNFYCHLHVAILKMTNEMKLELPQNYLYWNWQFSQWYLVILQNYSLFT